jgi:hypothetical protein
MRLRVKVEHKEIYVEVLGDLEVRPYKGKYEVLVRAVDVAAVFPVQEKLLILTRGSENFAERVKEILSSKDEVYSQEEFEDILKAADEASK